MPFTVLITGPQLTSEAVRIAEARGVRLVPTLGYVGTDELAQVAAAEQADAIIVRQGQITVQGPYYDNLNSVLSITGVTRADRNSRGQIVLRARAHGTQYDFIFQLS